PSPTDSAPCGSMSTRSTWWLCSARAAPRLMAVVVLPTPPFWLARAMTFPISGHLRTARGAICRLVALSTGRVRAGASYPPATGRRKHPQSPLPVVDHAPRSRPNSSLGEMWTKAQPRGRGQAATEAGWGVAGGGGGGGGVWGAHCDEG